MIVIGWGQSPTQTWTIDRRPRQLKRWQSQAVLFFQHKFVGLSLKKGP